MLSTRRLLLFLGAVHATLFLYDLAHPDRFMRADRADKRMEAIQSFAAAWAQGAGRSDFVASHGIPGDWLPHAMLYMAGGQFFIIAFQVGLVLLSVLWVRDIARRAGLAEASALASAGVYGLLPQTLV